MSKLLRTIFLAASAAFSPLLVPALAGGILPQSMSVISVTQPGVFLDTSSTATPANGNVIHVHAGDSLQAVVDAAVPGDTILVDAGYVLNAALVIAPRSGGIAGEWIILKSAGTLPAANQRMTQSRAAACNIPKLSASFGLAPLTVTDGASKFRIQGFEMVMADSVTASGGALVNQQAGCSDIIIDQCYVHGSDVQNIHLGIVMEGARLALVNSSLRNVHSQLSSDIVGVLCVGSPGPLKIVNNEIEAETEVIAFGGGAPVDLTTIPSDIEIRGNWIHHDLRWKGSIEGNFEKNLIEFKCGKRVLIEGNLIETAWYAAQVGYALILWSVNQDNNFPLAETAHITVRNNIIKNTASGVGVSGFYASSPEGRHPSVTCHDVAIHNNLFIGLNSDDVTGGGGAGDILQVTQAKRVSFEHNTCIMNAGRCTLLLASYLDPADNVDYTIDGVVIRNNIVGSGNYPLLLSSNVVSTWSHVTAGNGVMLGNVFVFYNGTTQFNVYGAPTAGNAFVTDASAVGFAGGGGLASSLRATPADLVLSPSSPFKGVATDTLDPGCDPLWVSAVVADALGGN